MPRPRSDRAHRKVLDAALDLFARHGIDATSMDAISETSGVSKATIYKHWADKEALCLEALVRAHGAEDLPAFDSGDLRQDLAAFLGYRSTTGHGEAFRRLLPHFMAYAARNPGFGRAWKSRVMEPPRARLRQLLERGMKNGELAPDLDIPVATALLLGPILYRFATESIAAQLPENLPQRVVEAFLKAYGVRRLRRRAAAERVRDTEGRI